MQKIELNNVFIELLSPNIIQITIKNNSVIEVEDILAIKKANLELAKGVKYGIITESGSNTTVSEKARTLMATEIIEKDRVATAFVINNLSQRLLGKFYLKINKPNTPTKMFSTLKEALIWIESQTKNL